MGSFSDLHWINVGPKGTFQASGDHQTLPADVDRILERIAKWKPEKLLLYFHGGLVSEKAGYAGAQRVHRDFQSLTYPLAFIWETGVGETLGNLLRTAADTLLFRKVRAKAEAHAVSLEEDRKRNPVINDLKARILVDLDEDPDIQAILKREEAGYRLLLAQLSLHRRVAPTVLETLALAIAWIAWEVFKRFRNQTDHGHPCTVVEETLRAFGLAGVGAWFYSGITGQAADMWKANPQGTPDETFHAGRYFLDGLKAVVAEHPKLKIDLIGHSAGSIAICRLLQAIGSGGPHLRSILFVAPAVSCDLFYREVVKKTQRYTNFRMFTMEEELEQQDPMMAKLPKPYPWSLLYFVSGVLEQKADMPLSGLDVHTKGKNPYNTNMLSDVAAFLAKTRQHRQVLSIQTGQAKGLNSAGTVHGSFDAELHTVTSLQEIIAL